MTPMTPTTPAPAAPAAPAVARPARPDRGIARLFGGHLLFLGLALLVTAALAGLLVIAIAASGTVGTSVWDHAFQLGRWFVLGYGAHLTHSLLPTCVAHGRTRREYLANAAVFVVVAAAVLAVLTAGGYALERAVYQAAGWRHALSEHRPFTDGGQFGAIAAAYWALFAVWLTAGTVIGAGFYRSRGAELAAVPTALLMVMAAGIATGYDHLPFVTRLARVDPAAPAAAALTAAALALGAAVTWAISRDVPLRNKSV